MSGEAQQTEQHRPDSYQRIADATIDEILKHGVLGLRVAAVAELSGVSVALIYKYFGNRDGLIAKVLSERIASDYEKDNTIFFERFPVGITKIDLDELMEIIPMPDEEFRKQRRWLRIEAKAASQRIPELRTMLASSIERIEKSSERAIVAARELSGNNSPVPAKTIAWVLSTFADGFASRDISDHSISDDLYRIFIEDLIKRHIL